MSASPFDRLHQPDLLSRIGGAAQGGSAKPKKERERLDREHELERQEPPAGSQDDVPAASTEERPRDDKLQPGRDAP